MSLTVHPVCVVAGRDIGRGLRDEGLVMSRRQRRELFRLADPDRSGTIDVRELADFLYDVEVSCGDVPADLGAVWSKAHGRGLIAP